MVASFLSKMIRLPGVLLNIFRPRRKRFNSGVRPADDGQLTGQFVPDETARARGSSTVPEGVITPENKIKLVVWDLDDTFWSGTLSEGGVTAIDRNIDLVKHLTSRGIVNSICSKNDEEQARNKLIELGIYDHFVFSRIGFDPKGKTIAELIEVAALRAENVLFIDDNRLNLQEVRFFNPGIMLAHPADVLDLLWEHPNAAGRPDPEMTRLKQYQVLQRKSDERKSSTVSNEEFLRASGIRIAIDYNVEANLDRVVELINRSNQLNYTKERLNTPEEINSFQERLRSHGAYAGCVHAADNYGNYGLIGFFLLRRGAGIKKLEHFVFSCRTMHMGIEQFIFEKLDRPRIDIQQPVSYGLQPHKAVDWITLEEVPGTVPDANGKKLLLVGGCEMLQLANYCSSSRVEFTNKMQNKVKIRYDNPGFIIGDRRAIRECKSLTKIPFWTYEDTERFDEAVASSELILLYLYKAVTGIYFRTKGNVLIQFARSSFKRIKKDYPGWIGEDAEAVQFSESELLKLVMDSFDSIASASREGCRIFVLGCYTACQLNESSLRRKSAYNRECRAYCANHPERFAFVDPDTIVPPKQLHNASHYTREGYFMLAREIMTSFGTSASAADPRGDAASGEGPPPNFDMDEYRPAAE